MNMPAKRIPDSSIQEFLPPSQFDDHNNGDNILRQNSNTYVPAYMKGTKSSMKKKEDVVTDAQMISNFNQGIRGAGKAAHNNSLNTSGIINKQTGVVGAQRQKFDPFFDDTASNEDPLSKSMVDMSKSFGKSL